MQEHLKVHLKLCDDVPFLFSQYVMKEGQKPVLEKEINHLEKVGIMKKGLTEYRSSVLLVKEYTNNLYTIWTDFQVLNDKWVKINHAYPLMKDCIK